MQAFKLNQSVFDFKFCFSDTKLSGSQWSCLQGSKSFSAGKQDFWEKGRVCRAKYGPPFNKLLSKLNLLDICVSQIYFANCGLPKNMNKCFFSFIAWLGLIIIRLFYISSNAMDGFHPENLNTGLFFFLVLLGRRLCFPHFQFSSSLRFACFLQRYNSKSWKE